LLRNSYRRCADGGWHADYTLWSGSNRLRWNGGLPRPGDCNNALYLDGHVKITPPMPRAQNLPSQAQGALPWATAINPNNLNGLGAWGN
jgi:prepilin-type processing-associated H-X9-DG protein